MEKKKLNIVEVAMQYHEIVIFLTCCIVALGIWALVDMNKNEFPDYTIRQGIVAAVYPGATSHQVEEELTKPLENYIFTYKEVKKEKTKSFSRDGMCIIQIELNDDVNGADKDNFWNRFKHGVQTFKASLPSGVLAIQVTDDFGDASARLITMESSDKTYRELNDYMDDLKDRLRQIESVGRLNVYGGQSEQISVYVDTRRLSQYGISQSVLSAALLAKGFITASGTQKAGAYEAPIHVRPSLNMVNDVEQMIIYSGADGEVVRVKDIADVKREYPEPTSFVTNNGVKCLVLSVEMKKGRNITEMGKEIDREMDEFKRSLPEDVTMFSITDQSQVVRDSVVDFLRELLIAVVSVIIVVLLLLPIRVALVAAGTIPITIFISLGLFYMFGIELNTVTLAVLIVALGMIVDNSIVIIDNYMELLSEGVDRWDASVRSATHFFQSILTATLAISITFFPFLFTTTGMYHDFVRLFPVGLTIVLMTSLFVAELVVPFLQYHFIREPMDSGSGGSGKKKFSLLGAMQSFYDKVVNSSFSHAGLTVFLGCASVVLGAFLLLKLPQRLMPVADRNQFAVEIYLPAGSSLDKTAAIADSLEHILGKDKRVVSIASFKGTSSPRFQTAYAPQFGGKNYAQFIVNTTGTKATEEVLADYRMRYTNAFPGAYVRFKQLSYSTEGNSVEIRLSGNDWDLLKRTADSLTAVMRTDKDLILVRNNVDGSLLTDDIDIDEVKAGRLGISNAQVELTLATRYMDGGIPLTTIWDGDYPIPVKLKTVRSDLASSQDIADEQIPVLAGLKTVPLRQIATVKPKWEDGQICHLNGIPTITVYADVVDGKNVLKVTEKLERQIRKLGLPDGVELEWGGEKEVTDEVTPQVIGGLAMSIAIIFFLLLFHLRKLSTSVLLLVSLSLTLFGTAMGVLIPGGEFSFTCYLGIISLMGILVRNAIIMYDYAEELRKDEGLSVKEAIMTSAKRRMRPIFLTSAAASVGVIPMVLAGSGLWCPMGNVIFYGTIITMIFILTILPVAYWLVEKRDRSI
jgi:multidrug efflux pump subunit AcrB